jgi:hypothetical protein
MPRDNRSELPAAGNGPRHNYSAAAAAEIINLHLDSSQPKPVLYGRILATILNAMHLAEEDLRQARWEPKEN